MKIITDHEYKNILFNNSMKKAVILPVYLDTLEKNAQIFSGLELVYYSMQNRSDFYTYFLSFSKDPFNDAYCFTFTEKVYNILEESYQKSFYFNKKELKSILNTDAEVLIISSLAEYTYILLLELLNSFKKKFKFIIIGGSGTQHVLLNSDSLFSAYSSFRTNIYNNIYFHLNDITLIFDDANQILKRCLLSNEYAFLHSLKNYSLIDGTTCHPSLCILATTNKPCKFCIHPINFNFLSFKERKLKSQYISENFYNLNKNFLNENNITLEYWSNSPGLTIQQIKNYTQKYEKIQDLLEINAFFFFSTCILRSTYSYLKKLKNPINTQIKTKLSIGLETFSDDIRIRFKGDKLSSSSAIKILKLLLAKTNFSINLNMILNFKSYSEKEYSNFLKNFFDFINFIEKFNFKHRVFFSINYHCEYNFIHLQKANLKNESFIKVSYNTYVVQPNKYFYKICNIMKKVCKEKSISITFKKQSTLLERLIPISN